MLRLQFKTKKSAGIRVTRETFSHISDGNSARDRGDWHAAREAYHQALALNPKLHHIRMQLGHALKHVGRLREADVAYALVSRACPDQIEPLKFRAYLAKDAGRIADAIRYFKQGLKTGLRDAAADEISQLIGATGPLSATTLSAILEEIDPARSGARAVDPTPAREMPPDEATAGRPLLFDLTDLVAHFQGQRLPNGIERVQIELTLAALHQRGSSEIKLCGFINGREEWVEIPWIRFQEVARLATSGSDVADPAWQAARAHLVLHLIFAPPIVPPQGAALVNTGTSWRVHDYFRFIRNLKARHGISYIPFVHDLIPIVAAQYCAPGITEDFISWLIGAIPHADGFLVNSRATRDDLVRIAEQLGCPIAEDKIAVVPLDADFRAPANPAASADVAAWDLAATDFALMVSTVEPRKSHILALDAWAALIGKHGAERVPLLVCAGRKGWHCDQVFARLDQVPALKAHVLWIHDASDAQLVALYQACAFTVYPSAYEGWGLPVTEALANGKIPVIADNSSLPEAGAGFALTFRSGSVPAFVEALEKMIFDTGWKKARERQIKQTFKPRSWAQLGSQAIGAVNRIADAAQRGPILPETLVNRYYPVRLQRQHYIWRGLASGEIFRIGDGWSWPGADSCHMRPGGALLRFRIAGRAARPLRLCLRVQGLASRDCPVAISINGAPPETFTVLAGASPWLTCQIGTFDDIVSVMVEAEATEAVAVSVCGLDKTAVATLAVLGFLLDDGIDALVAKALSVNDPDRLLQRLDAYRDPRAVVSID